MNKKSIRNSSNRIYIVLFLLVINLALQTTLQKTLLNKENNSLKTKNLNGVTNEKNIKNGGKCDTNSQCKSGYCGYNGPFLSKAPHDYSLYACMEKYSKSKGEACWHNKECHLQTGLIRWSYCEKVTYSKTNKIVYKCN